MIGERRGLRVCACVREREREEREEYISARCLSHKEIPLVVVTNRLCAHMKTYKYMYMHVYVYVCERENECQMNDMYL